MKLRRETLYKSLMEFYGNPENLQQLTDVLQEGVVSLRTMDWLVTNYSKVEHRYVERENECPINIFNVYKAAQRSWRKQMMDPFRRGPRITMVDSNGKKLETTLGQLNFFRWAMKNGILKYAIDNAADIEDHMLKTACKRPKKGTEAVPGKRRRKREELSRAAYKRVTRTRIKVTL